MHATITGIGIVSPYGVGRELFWHAARAGKQALRPVTRFDASAYRNTLGGEVPEFDSGTEERAFAFAVQAAREAVEQAGLDLAADEPVGLILGTNFGGMGCAEEAFRNRANGEPLQPLTKYLAGHVLQAVRAALPSTGPEAVLSLSCASGAAALGVGLQWIRQGRCEVVLAGGFDELSETAFAGLSALRAISKDTIRPWDANRDGTIFSEGAGVLVLEHPQRAARRGATALAKLLGRGINNDAFHMTAPEKEGRGIQAVMRMALADAGLEPDKVAHLNLHGTGTKYNDLIETTAVRGVFGTHAERMVFTAGKSLFGHAMGAAGALEAAMTALSVRDGIVPPTLGCDEPDPEIVIDLCRGGAREVDLPVAVTNSYGLGGTNASLVLARA